MKDSLTTFKYFNNNLFISFWKNFRYTLFHIRTSKIGPLFLKFSWFLGYIILNLFLFSPNFLKIFHNTVMIYTRNRSNDTTESQEEKKIHFMLM